MDFAVPAELEEVRASFLSFIDREVRPVEERFRAELQDDRWTDEMRDAANVFSHLCDQNSTRTRKYADTDADA